MKNAEGLQPENNTEKTPFSSETPVSDRIKELSQDTQQAIKGPSTPQTPLQKNRPASERLKRPPKTLFSEDFKEKTGKLSLEGEAQKLVQGALQVISIAEKMVEQALLQGDKTRAEEYAFRLSQLSRETDQLFRIRLASSETWTQLTESQYQLDLIALTNKYLNAPSAALIEDVISTLRHLNGNSTIAEEEFEHIENCFTQLVHFTYEAKQKMSAQGAEEPFTNIHQQALRSIAELLAFMLAISPEEKDERYQERIAKRAHEFIIRKYSIRMLVALLIHASQSAETIETAKEFSSAIGDDDWLNKHGANIIKFEGDTEIKSEAKSRVYTGVAAIHKDNLLRELAWGPVSMRYLGTLAKHLDDKVIAPSQEKKEMNASHPEEKGHMRHILNRIHKKLIAAGDLPEESEPLYPTPPTTLIYPEVSALEEAVDQAKAALQDILKHAANIHSAPQGPTFNPHLEYRNRGLTLLRERLRQGNIGPFMRAQEVFREAEEIEKAFTLLSKTATEEAYDPQNISEITAKKQKPHPNLQKRHDLCKANLRKIQEDATLLLEEAIIPESQISTEELQNISTAFPGKWPLSQTMLALLKATEKAPLTSPSNQIGREREFLSENFTELKLIGRGVVGAVPGHRAYGIAYHAKKRMLSEDQKIREVPVILVRCYIHEKNLEGLQEEINTSTDQAGHPTGLYVVKDPFKSHGFAPKTVFVEYPNESPTHINTPPSFLTAADLRIESFLARGGFGMVYSGKNSRDHHIVVKAGLTEEHDPILNREHKVASQLDHPHIVTSSRLHTVTDPLAMYGIPRGRTLLEMPYAEGMNPLKYLQSKAQEEGIDPEHKGQYILWATDKVIEIGLQITDAALHAHSNQICHLDITPRNIRVKEQDGAPFAALFDWGAAAEIGSESIENTLPFSAPETIQIFTPEISTEKEQLLPFEVHPRVESFNIGATLGALLLGNADLWDTQTIIDQAPGNSPYNIKELLDYGIFSSVQRAKETINPFDHDRLRQDRTIQEKTIIFKEGHPTELLLRLLRKATHPTPSERIQEVEEIKKGLQALKGLLIHNKKEAEAHEARLAEAKAARKLREKEEKEAKKRAEEAEKKAAKEAEAAAKKEETQRLEQIRAELARDKARRTATGAYSRSEVMNEKNKVSSPEASPETPDRSETERIRRKRLAELWGNLNDEGNTVQ